MFKLIKIYPFSFLNHDNIPVLRVPVTIRPAGQHGRCLKITVCRALR